MSRDHQATPEKKRPSSSSPAPHHTGFPIDRDSCIPSLTKLLKDLQLPVKRWSLKMASQGEARDFLQLPPPTVFLVPNVRAPACSQF